MYTSEPEWSCESRTREGYINPNFNDGPKWVCGLATVPANNCLLLSFGSNNDINFESTIFRARGCEAHVYDPTVDVNAIAARLKSEANGTMHGWGLGVDGGTATHNGMSMQTFAFDTLMQRSGILGRHVDILKVRRPLTVGLW
jgi:hypothetical protein